jgi:3'(2'), 5'-bisphosphate nucleotidase
MVNGLAKITPQIFVVSEENESNDFTGDLFWLLDPIDGTKYYIKGLSGYTINLALIWKNQPIIGFVYHPSLQEIHYNDFDGKVMLYNTANGKSSLCYNADTELIKILIKDGQQNATKVYDNSIFSMVFPTQVRSKIAMIINNEADVYYLYSQVMEWDTAPVHAILKALGGNIIDMKGNELVYGKPFYCNPSVIICNQNALNEKQIILSNI